eukprot:g24552.t1
MDGPSWIDRTITKSDSFAGSYMQSGGMMPWTSPPMTQLPAPMTQPGPRPYASRPQPLMDSDPAEPGSNSRPEWLVDLVQELYEIRAKWPAPNTFQYIHREASILREREIQQECHPSVDSDVCGWVMATSDPNGAYGGSHPDNDHSAERSTISSWFVVTLSLGGLAGGAAFRFALAAWPVDALPFALALALVVAKALALALALGMPLPFDFALESAGDSAATLDLALLGLALSLALGALRVFPEEPRAPGSTSSAPWDFLDALREAFNTDLLRLFMGEGAFLERFLCPFFPFFFPFLPFPLPRVSFRFFLKQSWSLRLTKVTLPMGSSRISAS